MIFGTGKKTLPHRFAVLAPCVLGLLPLLLMWGCASPPSSTTSPTTGGVPGDGPAPHGTWIARSEMAPSVSDVYWVNSTFEQVDTSKGLFLSFSYRGNYAAPDGGPTDLAVWVNNANVTLYPTDTWRKGYLDVTSERATNEGWADVYFDLYGDGSNPDRVPYSRTLTDGTVGVLDFQDAHTVVVALTGFFFDKTVADLTSGVDPAATASPGDTLRYTLRFPAPPAPETPAAPSVDEMTFLKSVTLDSPASRERAAAENRPTAPPKGRSPNAVKTLKCAECGSMNRPTEWYCERCGAELAAL